MLKGSCYVCSMKQECEKSLKWKQETPPYGGHKLFLLSDLNQKPGRPADVHFCSSSEYWWQKEAGNVEHLGVTAYKQNVMSVFKKSGHTS